MYNRIFYGRVSKKKKKKQAKNLYLKYISDIRTVPKLEHWKMFIGPGLALYCNQLFFIVGLKLSSSVTASAWQPSQSIIAVVLGICLRTEKNVDVFKICGILFGTGGALFMILFNSDNGGNSVWQEFGGSICFFLNCTGTALYLILGRRCLLYYGSSTVTGYSYIVATCVMIVTATIVASSNELSLNLHMCVLKWLCNDCENWWTVPTITVYALLYWVIMQSLCSYLLMTWANKFADPSVNLAYTVLQPFTAAVVSEIILSFHWVNKCHGSDDSDSSCLYGASYQDLGAIGIIIGLYFVIYSDRKHKLQNGQTQKQQQQQIAVSKRNDATLQDEEPFSKKSISSSKSDCHFFYYYYALFLLHWIFIVFRFFLLFQILQQQVLILLKTKQKQNHICEIYSMLKLDQKILYKNLSMFLFSAIRGEFISKDAEKLNSMLKKFIIIILFFFLQN
ncbi:hypothetical protein RFI_04688 [Reticulomyxa filosa]|uniref:EamA domain-containing protein n=1 Tax=Reticulomyxa filosa TaxID=46433 RepID=X6P4B1_RETFI|nr:hypothetical protein RFI_04688 [Reticulomyxa filosa]|eukprot:ETO32427.1 hypothetical protein RFI_04688 [Reticulomyxa filosa]